MALGLKNPQLYRMLRPELIRANETPLSSDAYCKLEMESARSREEVEQAYTRLQQVVIPRFAQWLDGQEALGPFLPSYLHQAGINLRSSHPLQVTSLRPPRPPR